MSRTFKRILAGTAAIALAAACTTVAAETRISSTLAAVEFNDVASQYMERPTFVSVSSFSDGNTALKVLMDEYGTGYNALLKTTTEHSTYFDRRYVSDYLPLIDKYLEWETLAVERGDLIERPVGSAKTWGVGGDIELRFGIHSANAARHLLVIESCAFGTCVENALHLSRANASILRGLLVDFAAGKVDHLDTNSIYK